MGLRKSFKKIGGGIKGVAKGIGQTAKGIVGLGRVKLPGVDARSEAAASRMVSGPVTRQAGAGQVKYTEERQVPM